MLRGRTACCVCMHRCQLAEGQTGRCRARKNQNGVIIPANYGMVTALALDPIEKKPLYHFYPGHTVLSVGSFGCNLSCPFCQNHEISQNGEELREYRGVRSMRPAELAELAAELADRGSIGLAYTYNEALVGYEFVRDTAREVRTAGLKNIVVTNGSVELSVMEDLFPLIDAMNIDLKGFTEEAYQKLGGSLELVRAMIERAASMCHVELTSLIVPGLNDSLEDFERQVEWIASIDARIPLHITRFFPNYHMKNAAPTDITLMERMKRIAEQALTYVHLGNI